MRRVAVGAVVAVAIVLAGVSWVNYTARMGQRPQRWSRRSRDACAVDRVVGHGTLESLGNPVVFVLTHRKSPTNYIYLASGVDRWKIKHTKDGFHGWVNEIVKRHPPAINVDGWKTAWTKPMVRALRAHGYKHALHRPVQDVHDRSRDRPRETGEREAHQEVDPRRDDHGRAAPAGQGTLWKRLIAFTVMPVGIASFVCRARVAS